MTDAATLAAYDLHASAYADDWLSQPPPADLQETVRRWFRSGADGGRTVDIGCGSGRDVDWLNRNGFPCTGYDASDALLAEARKRFPAWNFAFAELPGLDDVASASADNVLCETVLMHLPTAAIGPAIEGLRRVLAPDGTLYLSWRVSDVDQRDERGRLYSHVDLSLVTDALADLSIVYSVEATSASSKKRIHTVVARGPASSASRDASR